MNNSKALNRLRTVRKADTTGTVQKSLTIALKFIVYAFFITFTFVTVYPLLWAFISSFKTSIEIIQKPLALPKEWTIEGYKFAIRGTDLGILALNSLLYTFVTTVITTVSAITTSYAFTKIRFKISRIFEALFTAAIFIPTQAIIIPLSFAFNMLGIYDTKGSMILIYTAINLPLSIYLATNFMKTLSDTPLEAARLEGAGRLKVLTAIIAPQCRPVIIAIAFITALRCWGDFFITHTMSKADQTRGLMRGIYSITGCACPGYETHFAALVMGIFLPVAGFLIFRKSIFKGIGDSLS